MITESTIKYLAKKFDFKTIRISKISVGIYLTAVKLSDGSCGVSSTVSENEFNCKKEQRDFGIFTPCQIKNQTIEALFNLEKKSALIQTIKAATLNALSSTLINSNNYLILENSDPINLLEFTESSKVVIVGGFNSYISKIIKTTKNIHILEYDKLKIYPDYRQFFVDASEFKKTLKNADFVIITGMSLINETIDQLLENIPTHSIVTVTGPSISLVPDILFENKVDIIGSTLITTNEKLFELVEEGGTGFHLFKYCANKISIINNSFHLSPSKKMSK